MSFPGKWKVRPFNFPKLFAHWLYYRSLPSYIWSEPIVKNSLITQNCPIPSILQS